MAKVFDTLAETYDGWYDTPDGRAIFEAERDCLLSLCSGPLNSWLEVGVGTGRFAHALGISTGVDPSPKMLEKAAGRGIETCVGSAERLPFAEDSFDGVLMAFTLCFVADAPQALRECRRVLRSGGRLLLGIVPAGSAWGREYRVKAARGHAIYRHARFRGVRETIDFAQTAHFALCGTAGALFWEPGQAAGQQPEIRFHCGEEAGFLGLLFQNSAEDGMGSLL
jgi:SAM-dependent methyltransferase